MKGGITLINNEIKDIMKVIKSLENRGILLKGKYEKVLNQKGGFLPSLMRFSSLLIKDILTSLAKDVLLPLGVTAAVSATIKQSKEQLKQVKIFNASSFFN